MLVMIFYVDLKMKGCRADKFKGIEKGLRHKASMEDYHYRFFMGIWMRKDMSETTFGLCNVTTTLQLFGRTS